MRNLRLGGIVLSLATILSLAGCSDKSAPEPPADTQGYNSPSSGPTPAPTGPSGGNGPGSTAPAPPGPKGGGH